LEDGDKSMRASFVLLIASVALVACAPAAQPTAETQTPAVAVTLTANGAASELQPLPADENMEWAASVVRVDMLANQQGAAGVKLFGLAGGDPAMNGLYTQIAFFQGPADGWRVFRIGDFLDYRVLADSPGRVDLEISESVMNDNGDIGSQTRHVIVTWTPGADGAAPAAISVTPAQTSN
jgi:hypothetical protein